VYDISKYVMLGIMV